MKLSIVRGAFLNPFELQNYYPLKDKYNIRAISSKHPINENIDIPLAKLWSPTDLSKFPYKYPVLNRIFTDAHYLFNLSQAIKGSDIVHVAETYYHYTIQSIKEKRKGNIGKIVSTVWEVIPHNNEGIRGRKEFKKLSYKYIDHFIAVTSLAKAALVKEGVEPEKVTVIPMGVDLKRFSQSIHTNVDKRTNILFIGRLVPEKGVLELAEAFDLIYQKNKKVRLIIVGDGPLKERLSIYDGVEIKAVPYKDIHQEYGNANIFCLPSQTRRYWQEQFGMVLVEAMASGLPIITTQTGAIGEVCGEVARYVKPNSVNDLKQALEELIDNQTLREHMGRAGLNRALLLYDHRKVAERIEKIYEKLSRE